jgi:hypothetical protein
MAAIVARKRNMEPKNPPIDPRITPFAPENITSIVSYALIMFEMEQYSPPAAAPITPTIPKITIPAIA